MQAEFTNGFILFINSNETSKQTFEVKRLLQLFLASLYSIIFFALCLIVIIRGK